MISKMPPSVSPLHLGGVDGFDHLLLGFGICATGFAGFAAFPDLLERQAIRIRLYRTECHDVADDVDSDSKPDSCLHTAANGHAHRCLAGAGALENVACVFPVVLDDPGKIGMTGPWLVTGGSSSILKSLFLTINVTRRADGFATAHAGENFGGVGFQSSSDHRDRSLFAGARGRD